MAVPGDKPVAAPAPGDDKKISSKKDDKKDKEEELSEEDAALKANLELMVTRLTEDDDVSVQEASLTTLVSEIRSATASMTSVPKPLKFLREHFEPLKLRFTALKPGGKASHLLADILSMLATTSSKVVARESLKYRLLGTPGDIGCWGHEYLRHLAGEISEEFVVRSETPSASAAVEPSAQGDAAMADAPGAASSSTEGLGSAGNQDLLSLVTQIVPYHMQHNAEPEAVDLLLEVDRLDLLAEHVDAKNYSRTCLYLTSCCSYLPEPDDALVLNIAHSIYMTQAKYHDALRVAIRLNVMDTIVSTFAACTDPLEKKQLGYLLARHGLALDLEDGPAAVADESLRESLREICSNSKLSEHFLALGRDLDVMEAKVPEDVYKSHLTEGRSAAGAAAIDSARINLASTFVNAFVNAGFGTDKLVTVGSEAGAGADNVHWIFKNKDHGKTSATASLGLITLWDVEGGLPQIDKYLYSTDSYVVSGALMAIGIVNAGVQNENDPAFALIYDYVSNPDVTIRTGAILGLGLAYAGTCREESSDRTIPSLHTAPQALMMRSDLELALPSARFMCLALGMVFLGKQDTVEATVEIAKTLNPRVSGFLQATLDGMAYAGTGNVLKVQQLLALCGEHNEADEAAPWNTLHQAPAVIGLALIGMAEPVGAQMAGRALEHLLQYGEPCVRRAVPLAMSLLYVSNPDINAMDTLSRLSHDTDQEVAQAAVLALGIMGAGTNNARLAGILRSLSSYYYKEPTLLFLVKMVQGLVHMGKGLLTLSPYHTDRQLMSGVALSGLLTVLFSALDMKATLAGKHHYLLYFLATAMKPRMLLTLDEDGKLLPVPCRVGTAVDTVAQAGRPKSISGFQTHTTPVLLGANERAELATDKYIALSPILEGQVILRLNPDYVEMD
ncbi:MAG: hypothetical protein WDW38_009646 [Sanguina aurantia]